LWGGSSSRLHGGEIFFVVEYVLHSDYDWRTLDYDIAALRVSTGSPMSGIDFVTPIAIPEACPTSCCTVCEDGPDITVTGWGASDNIGSPLPELLLQVSKPISNQEECDAIWGDVTDRMFCTGIIEGRDSCG